MDFNHVTQDERERLYKEVWTDPVTVVAQRYGMSDNGLRKHLKRLWIPLPPNGYWAKVKAGQKVAKPDLPQVRGELKRHVSNYFIKYKGDLKKLSDEELENVEELNLLTDETITAIKEKCSLIEVKGQLRNPNILIEQHKEESTYRRKRDRALQQASFNDDYYRITKNKFRENQAMLPIQVSEVNLNRTYRILDALINAIDAMEGYTRVSLESGNDKGYFVVMRTIFYFEVKEENRKKPKTTDDETRPPLLVMSVHADDKDTRGVKYQLEFKDREGEPLEAQVGKILHDLFVAGNKMIAEWHLSYRALEREIEESDRKWKLEKMRRGEIQELELLEQAASDWDKAQRIRSFTEEMTIKIKEVDNEEKRNKLTQWVMWARDKADWLDPLTAKEDELLGRRKHIFDTIIEGE